MSLGISIALIALAGYASARLTGRFLDHRPMRSLYYLGALIHECSHALLCLATGARIMEFSVFSAQPHVTHGRPKLPLLGQALVSIAPIAGGMAFLFAVDHMLLNGHLAISAATGWRDVLAAPLKLLEGLRPLEWQSWAMAILMLNAGPMLGPSPQDLKNMWPALVVLLFISSPFLASLGAAALSVVLAGIALQIGLIVAIAAVRAVRHAL